MPWVNNKPPSGILDAADIAKFGPVAAAQIRLAAILGCWGALQPIASRVTWQDRGTLDADVDDAMKLIGISVMIIAKGGMPKSAMQNAVIWNPCRFILSILEDPKVNRSEGGSGLTATFVAAEICKALAGQRLAQGQCALGDVVLLEDNTGAQHILVNVSTALLLSDDLTQYQT